MHRLAPVLLIGAALLLATSLGAPASPTVDSSTAPVPELRDVQASAVLTQVDVQVERLRERLATPPPPPAPSRDPFAFGSREPDVTAEASLLPPPVAPPPPPPVLPRLIGVVAERIEGAIVRRAFVSYGDVVISVGVGATIGPFTVRAIGPDGVELVDPSRETAHVVRIR